jgi:AmiR/NasT family two-component response regulator
MTPIERLENQFLIESLKMQLQEAKNRLQREKARTAALEIQMRREGWTEEDLNEVEPKIEQ